mmetsp:Transcript_5877/g.10186  ORF Transcript_5877/g.10186 Transcript_5877/m.10186 type:complete len:227 (+) Transcript_5877:548-1228(+)
MPFTMWFRLMPLSWNACSCSRSARSASNTFSSSFARMRSCSAWWRAHSSESDSVVKADDDAGESELTLSRSSSRLLSVIMSSSSVLLLFSSPLSSSSLSLSNPFPRRPESTRPQEEADMDGSGCETTIGWRAYRGPSFSSSSSFFVTKSSKTGRPSMDHTSCPAMSSSSMSCNSANVRAVNSRPTNRPRSGEMCTMCPKESVSVTVPSSLCTESCPSHHPQRPAPP